MVWITLHFLSCYFAWLFLLWSVIDTDTVRLFFDFLTNILHLWLWPSLCSWQSVEYELGFLMIEITWWASAGWHQGIWRLRTFSRENSEFPSNTTFDVVNLVFWIFEMLRLSLQLVDVLLAYFHLKLWFRCVLVCERKHCIVECYSLRQLISQLSSDLLRKYLCDLEVCFLDNLL